jgi:hypothetical protein
MIDNRSLSNGFSGSFAFEVGPGDAVTLEFPAGNVDDENSCDVFEVTGGSTSPPVPG